MTSKQGGGLDLIRGGRAALLLAIIGAVTPVALMVGITVVGWHWHAASEWDRRNDLCWLQDRMIGPVVGCAVLLGSTGWATFAPCGRHHFATALLILFLLSFGTWFILESISLPPQRLKGGDHPVFYPSEFLLLTGPPIIGALWLSLRRASFLIKPVTDSDFA